MLEWNEIEVASLMAEISHFWLILLELPTNDVSQDTSGVGKLVDHIKRTGLKTCRV